MNIQDIADFLDLVKNPAKYERVLSNIKAEPMDQLAQNM